MKEMSLEYQEAMKFPFRNRWLMNLYIGFIQENFQKTAQVKIEPDFSFLSKNCNEYLFSNAVLDRSIATFEKDMFRADGSSAFTDKAHSFADEMKYGLISEDTSDSNGNINFTMSFKSKQDYVGLKGLTMYFVDTYPTEFIIRAYEEADKVFERKYFNENPDLIEIADVFGENANRLEITVTKMNKPYVRFRLRYILFGVGVSFDNKDFLAGGGSYKEVFDICSVYLPTKEFYLELDNTDERYNIDKTDSLINLASVGQDISLGISYVHDDGRIESIPNEKLELESFDVSPTSLKMKAVDFFRNENELVEIKPEFFTPDTTLYDLAVEAKKGLQNPSFTVELDESLKDVHVKPTYIKDTCKRVFMQIAGAGRCMMKLTDNGLIIRRTTYTQATFRFKSTDIAPYGNMNQLFDNNDPIKMATFESDYISANGQSRFCDTRPVSRFKTGYVSNSISSSDGVFRGRVPSLSIYVNETISLNQLKINFYDCTPKEVLVETFDANGKVDSFTQMGDGDELMVINHDFESFKELRITVKSINEAYRRVRIDKIRYSRRIYELTYEECKSKPIVNIESNVRNIIVDYFYWGKKDDEDTVIEDSVIIPCNTNGSDIEYKNACITSYENAREVAEWLRDYYATQIFYDIELVGDPSLETNDVIRVPDRYNDNILGNIEMNEIKFANGGISGNIKVRREDVYVVRTQNKLATY